MTRPVAAPNPLSTRPFHLLVVCTANQARSPLGEVIARDALARRGIDGWVRSAGFYPGGTPATSHAVAVAADLGLDLSRHLSCEVAAELVLPADLVVTMQVSHVLDLATRFPGSEAWTMTLKELALAATSGPMSVDEVHRWVRATAGRRRPQSLLSRSDMDVVDPAGRGERAFRRTSDELTSLFGQVFDRWFGAPS